MSQLAQDELRALDTTLFVVTPENVAFDFRLAGPAHRLVAMFVDLVIIFCLGLLTAFLLGMAGFGFFGLILFAFFALWWFYGGVMEAMNNGQTLGKKAMGLRVVSHTGLSINASQAVLRNILRGVDLMPPFFPGVVAMICNSRFQRLGDLAVGTIVVLDGQRRHPRPPKPPEDTTACREQIPMKFHASAGLIEALAAYVGRRGELSPSRRMELSGVLARHFQIAWSLPKGIDTDLLLCAMYETAGEGVTKVKEIIDKRTPRWRQLEADIVWAKANRRRKLDPQRVTEFAQRYRAVCADLALAISMRFPAGTVEYLHQLTADAHTQLYRGESFKIRTWGRMLMVDVPRRVLHDPCTWIAFALFWTLFGGAIGASMVNPTFASAIVGEETLAMVESMYAQPISSHADDDSRSFMTGFYVFNNAGIGLHCFASGLLFGVGSLMEVAYNAIVLGSIFGHMFQTPSRGNFIEFVTAHGPFELTAIALSAGAGLRLGWALIDTNGYSRAESLRRTAPRALEIAGVATILFLLAAYIEGFISPSALSYEFKAAVAIVCSLLLLGYVLGLGALGSRRERNAP